MVRKIDDKLASLGIVLPAMAAPLANYVPARRHGSQVYVSGQVPAEGGKDKFTGKLGSDYSVEEGQQAARLCAVNILAQLKQALDGDLDRVVGVIRLGGVRQRGAGFQGPSQGHQRSLRPDGRGVWRGGAPCSRCRRLLLAAAQCTGRDRRHF